ncbi:unnamed protein product [Amoebophrya sp. A25]|nr:unnamed protein product [Amoebophrya sp. A25]|eukprot:GSA25T00021929001.1
MSAGAGGSLLVARSPPSHLGVASLPTPDISYNAGLGHGTSYPVVDYNNVSADTLQYKDDDEQSVILDSSRTSRSIEEGSGSISATTSGTQGNTNPKAGGGLSPVARTTIIVVSTLVGTAILGTGAAILITAKMASAAAAQAVASSLAAVGPVP